jgi:hypothetical protein
MISWKTRQIRAPCGSWSSYYVHINVRQIISALFAFAQARVACTHDAKLRDEVSRQKYKHANVDMLFSFLTVHPYAGPVPSNEANFVPGREGQHPYSFF